MRCHRVGRGPAGANEIAELKAQIEVLQERLPRIEAEQETVAEMAVTAGDKAGSWKLPGSETSISIGEDVKGDFYFDSSKDLGAAFDPTSIALDDEKDATDDDGALGMHARQSRIADSGVLDGGSGDT